MAENCQKNTKNWQNFYKMTKSGPKWTVKFLKKYLD